ncbi:unnamed protein product, partial [Owenia fusiformis]
RTIQVTDIPCNSPKIKTNQGYLETVEHKKAVFLEIGNNKEFDVTLDCPPSETRDEAIYDFEWQVKYTSEEGVISTVELDDSVIQTYSSIQFAPGWLPYGIANISLTLNVQGVPDTTSTNYTLLEILSSPLIAEIEGGKERSVNSMERQVFSAAASFDPDVPEG